MKKNPFCFLSLPQTILFICLLGSIISKAQNTTSIFEEKEKKSLLLPKANLIVVPYLPTLYHSELDQKFVEINKLNIDDFRHELRSNLCNEIGLHYRLNHQEKTAFLSMTLEDDSVQKDLITVYENVTYIHHTLNPNVSLDTNKKNIISLFKKDPKNEKQMETHKANIHQGQIKNSTEYGDKFMDVNIKEREPISVLSNKYHANYWLFLNQIDILYKLDQGGFMQKYVLKVHYTIIDQNFNKLFSGTEELIFNENDIDLEHFYPKTLGSMAKKLAQKIP